MLVRLLQKLTEFKSAEEAMICLMPQKKETLKCMCIARDLKFSGSKVQLVKRLINSTILSVSEKISTVANKEEYLMAQTKETLIAICNLHKLAYSGNKTTLTNRLIAQYSEL